MKKKFSKKIFIVLEIANSKNEQISEIKPRDVQKQDSMWYKLNSSYESAKVSYEDGTV